MTRLLLVEDDAAIAEPLTRALQREGYDVAVCTTGADALADPGPVDVAVLDLGLPDVDGLEVCRRLRAGDAQLPIVLLTARAAELDVVVGLDAGADDYVTKPFRMAELLARVRAQLRRVEPAAAGPPLLHVDVAARRVTLGDRELALSLREFDLLVALTTRAGTVVRRENLMREVWPGDWWPSTKTLDVHVAWLRRKLGDDASDPTYVTTLRGVGFRFEHAMLAEPAT